jgi:hypothetical protein
LFPLLGQAAHRPVEPLPDPERKYQMPKITVIADRSGEPGQMTLSERIVSAHMDDDHYAAQLLERLAWAAADAEALEAQRPAAVEALRSSGDLAAPLPAEGTRRRVLAA